MKIFILALIPVFLLVIALLFKVHSGPYWLGTNSDPEYVYLLNSLNLVQRKTPGYFYHPGTPLQILGIPVIYFTHLFRSGTDTVTDVLTNSEVYLQVFSCVLLSFLILSVFLCGLLIFRLTHYLFLALIFQFTPFLTSVPLLVMHRVSPEPLMLITGLWFSYLVLYFYISPQKTGFIKFFFLALITGLSVSLKMDCLPLIIIPLIIFPGILKIRFLLFTSLTFLIFTLPVISLYPRMFKWFLDIFTHSGNYGTGEAKLVDISLFLKNIWLIFLTQPLLLILLLSFLYLLVKFFKNRSELSWYKYLAGFTVYFIVQIFLISKHFNFRYLIPVSVLMSLSGIFLLTLSPRHRYLLLSVFLFVGLINFTTAYLSFSQINPGWQEAMDIKNTINKDYPGSLVVSYYGNSSQSYSLKYANGFAGLVYSEILSVLYPDRYFLNLGSNSISDWTKVVSLPRGKTILFQGVPFTGEYIRFKPDFPLTDVYHGQTETIYRLIN